MVNFDRDGLTHPLHVVADFAPVSTFLKEDAFLDAIIVASIEGGDSNRHPPIVLGVVHLPGFAPPSPASRAGVLLLDDRTECRFWEAVTT